MAWHNNYWSIGKFADTVRGTVSIKSGTGKEWNDWTKQAKSAHPFRYWIVETAFGKVQDFVTFVPRKINDVRYYVNNRYQVKTHALTSNLPRGQYRDLGTRMIHCLFDEYVNYVEVELAWKSVRWDSDSKFKPPVWQRQWWTRWMTEWRCPEAGIAHLHWEIELKNDDSWVDKDSADYGLPTLQALAAMEKLAIYQWWKYVYANRPDPHDLSGWSEHCAIRRGDDDDNIMMWGEDRTDEERAQTRIILDKTQAIEKQYRDEDENMLIRLIRIRESLWT